MQEKIQSLIKEVLKSLDIPQVDFVIEHPADLSNGDYSTNVAFVLAKKEKANPCELAEKIKAGIEKNKPKEIEKIDIAGPGFINFYLSKKFFANELNRILKEGESYGGNSNLANKKIVLEYTNTNVLKPFHIGHLLGNTIGESLSRIFLKSGADVIRITYQGDVGLHIAKTIYGLSLSDFLLNYFASASKKINILGLAYARGARAYEENESAKTEIAEINKKIYSDKHPVLNFYYKTARRWSLVHFDELYQKLGTKFDDKMFESEVAVDAVKIAKSFLEKGVFAESDGAIVFKGEEYEKNLHTRVFVTSRGIPTYEAKDIAHAIRKDKKYSADLSIIVTANEQDNYFKVVLRALKEISPNIADKTKHLSHGMLRLSSGKMSSRTGDVITAENLIAQTKEKVLEKMADRKMSAGEKDVIAEKIAVGAIKYSILKQAPGRDIVFDFEKSLSFEGDSGPYLQYAHTRAKTVSGKSVVPDTNGDNGTILKLERMLARFGDIVSSASSEYAPQYIATYLIEIAGEFNAFYEKERIADNPYNSAVAHATAIILQNGLDILGIKIPEKM